MADVHARQQQVGQLFLTKYGTLNDAAFDAYPGLTIWDAEGVMNALQHNLSTYKGPLKAVAFERWATKFITKEVQRYSFIADIVTKYSRVIHAAIHRGMAQSEFNRAVDYGICHQDIYWEVIQLIFDKAHGLAKPGTAKMSTRLTALALRHVRLYHTAPLNRRHKLNRLRVESLGSYGLPEWEMAAPDPPPTDVYSQ